MMLASFTTLFLYLCIRPINAKQIWYNTTAGTTWERDALLLGNGKLGAAFFGGIQNDHLVLNVDSLWTGGPFKNKTYRGGNPITSDVEYLNEIRQEIMKNGNASIAHLMGSDDNYGSYSYLGQLMVSVDVDETQATGYTQWLDLDTGIGGSNFTVGEQQYERRYFCSYPAKACVYHLRSTGYLPQINISLSNVDRIPSPSVRCTQDGRIIFRGRAENGTNAMIYEAQTAIVSSGPIDCLRDGSILLGNGGNTNMTKEVTIIVAADTNYLSSNGNAESNYSFQGVDPKQKVAATIDLALKQSYEVLESVHQADYHTLWNEFALTLPDTYASVDVPVDTLINSYNMTHGNPYLENLTFDFSRYLMIVSTRPGSLPPNLQGKWSNGIGAAWSGDYHANINMQMNLWGSEMTGLGYAADIVYQYVHDTWVPRGTETAQLIYGSRGWTVHDEMNIFGHTGMKGAGDATAAQWADFPAAAAWIMQYIWDHYDYTRDEDWYRDKGYPLIKGVVEFWLDNLNEDMYFKDGTLVAAPCNSPEHGLPGVATFGCAIFQQLIYENFNNVLKAWNSSGEIDAEFKREIILALDRLDPGVAIGSWGQIKEWKIEQDNLNEQHRHLSNIYGFYPGYSISSVHRNDNTILQAVETTLIHRGLGKGPDADAGWEKVWRSACWAQLSNTSMAYTELKFTIFENIAENLLSMYSAKNPPFQIDANFGFGAAVLAMLVKDVDYNFDEWDIVTRRVVLGPAIPKEWANGGIRGLRLRGGIIIDFAWDEDSVVQDFSMIKAGSPEINWQFVNSEGKIL